MDYLLAILNATLCVHATEHSIYRVTQIEFKKIQCHPSIGSRIISIHFYIILLMIENSKNYVFVLQIDLIAILCCLFNCNPIFWNHSLHKRDFDLHNFHFLHFKRQRLHNCISVVRGVRHAYHYVAQCVNFLVFLSNFPYSLNIRII